MKKCIKRRIISILLCSLGIINSIIPSFAAASNNKQSTNLTYESVINGSPLLSDTFTTTNLTKEDHIASSMYLGSMIVPFWDNYWTALNSGSNSGSQGEMADRLVYKDEEGAQTIVNNYFLQLANFQIAIKDENHDVTKQDYIKPLYSDAGLTTLATYDLIKKRYLGSWSTTKEASNNTTLSGSNSQGDRTVTNNDFKLYMDTSKISAMTDGNGNMTDTGNPDENNGQSISNNEGPQVVFDSSDIEDSVAILMCMKLADFHSSNKALKSLNKSGDKPLCIDYFGNICLFEKKDGQEAENNIILLPNTYNPKILSKQYINLLSTNAVDQFKTSGHGFKIESLNKKSVFSDDEVKIHGDGGGLFYVHNNTIVSRISGSQFIDSYYEINDKTMSPQALMRRSGTAGNGKYWELSLLEEDRGYTTKGAIRHINRVSLFNYLLMCRPDAHFKLLDGNEVSIDSNNHIFDLIDATVLSEKLSQLYSITDDQKKSNITNVLFNLLTKPLDFANFLVKLFNQLLVFLYEGLSDFSGSIRKVTNIGFGKIGDLPIFGNFLNLLDNNLAHILFLTFILTIVLGMIRHDLLGTLARYIFCIAILICFPRIFNLTSDWYNTQFNQLFSKNEASWVLDYNIQFDKQNLKLLDNVSNALVSDNAAFENGNSLNYIQDKSPIVINNASQTTYNILTTSGLGSLWVSSIIKQFRNGNKISSTLDELFKRLIMLNYVTTHLSDGEATPPNVGMRGYYEYLFYNKTKSPDGGFFTKSEGGIENDTILKVGSLPITNDDSKSYANRSDPLLPNTSDNLYDDDGNEIEPDADEVGKETGRAHKSFYRLKGLSLSPPSRYATTFKNDELGGDYSSQLNSIYNTYFTSNAGVSGSVTPISQYNYYAEDDKYNSDYGYFILTENVIPYFYEVYKDTFLNMTKKGIGYQLQGKVNGNSAVKIDDGTKNGSIVASRDSVLMKNSQIIDYADLETLFTEVLPYCYWTSVAARQSYNTDDLVGDDYTIYRENPKSWIFDCNWAIKLMKTVSSNLDGANISNTSFCEYGKTSESDLSNLCVEFYRNLTPQIESLIDEINNEEVTKPVLLRQMAFLTGLQFNRTFSIADANLYPQYIDIGSINADSLWNDMLKKSYIPVNNSLSAADNLNKSDGNGLIHFFDIIIMSVCSVITCKIFPAFRAFLLMLFCFAVIFSLIIKIYHKDSSGIPMMETVLGIFVGYFKCLFLFSLPYLILLGFSSFSLSLPLTGKILVILIGTIGSCYIILKSVPQHVGWVDGHFDLQTCLALGGNKSAENIKSAFTAAKNTALGGAIATGVLGLGTAFGLAKGASAIHNTNIATGVRATIGENIGNMATNISDKVNDIKDRASKQYEYEKLFNPTGVKARLGGAMAAIASVPGKIGSGIDNINTNIVSSSIYQKGLEVNIAKQQARNAAKQAAEQTAKNTDRTAQILEKQETRRKIGIGVDIAKRLFK